MLKKIIISAIFALILSSCNCQKKAAQNTDVSVPKTNSKVVIKNDSKDKLAENTVRLKEKQNIFLKKQQMNATFKRVNEDSRCPKDVNCIWAGNATVEIELMTTTSRPQTFQLSVGDLRNSLVNSVDFAGYTITLENLYPNTSSENNFKQLQGKYFIELKIEKITN